MRRRALELPLGAPVALTVCADAEAAAALQPDDWKRVLADARADTERSALQMSSMLSQGEAQKEDGDGVGEVVVAGQDEDEDGRDDWQTLRHMLPGHSKDWCLRLLVRAC